MSKWRSIELLHLRGVIMAKPIDLIGQNFGRLTVVKRAPNNKEGRTMWLCKCVCGNEKVILGKSLCSGHTKSCGCLNKDITSKTSLKDRVGERFGRLVIKSRAEDYIAPKGKHHVRWLCQCDCGRETIVDICSLIKETTKSCGCLRTEKLSTGNNIKHGGRYDRLYRVFANMKNRCYNTNSKDYPYYGGRGIKICDEWLNNYLAFKTWSYNNGYDDTAQFGQCTIDRINVDGNYEPDNCRWVSMSTQSKNRRNVINTKN